MRTNQPFRRRRMVVVVAAVWLVAAAASGQPTDPSPQASSPPSSTGSKGQTIFVPALEGADESQTGQQAPREGDSATPKRSSASARSGSSMTIPSLPRAETGSSTVRPAPRPPGAFPMPKGRPMSDRELAERYRSVLALLAQGQLDAAGDALTAFETAAIVGNIEKQLDRLFKSEADIIRWIGGQELESIVPLLVLHLESSQRYRRQRHPILGQHARRMAISLANLYVKEAGTGASRQIGGWALTSLGGEVLKGGLHRSSLELFYQALELDPDNSLALLSVASVEEKHGHYESAVETLEALVRADPNNGQGRLRLAVNLGRLGKSRRAIEILDRLTHEEQAFEWVRAISFQELARLHVEADDWAKAEAVIHRGLEQYPGDGRLLVYLSYVLEHSARYRAALQIIRKVDDDYVSRDASPRYRYGLWPRGPAGEDPYDVMRVGLKQTAERRVARLAAVLSRVGVGAGAAAP